jgi:hypothetical protein
MHHAQLTQILYDKGLGKFAASFPDNGTLFATQPVDSMS